MKKWKLAILAFVLVFAITACGKDTEVSADNTKNDIVQSDVVESDTVENDTAENDTVENGMFKKLSEKYYFGNGAGNYSIPLVRLDVMPENTPDELKYLYETYGDDIIISIMNQYTPMGESEYSELNRKLTEEEYDEVVDFAVELGIENAFVQEGDTADESFIPDFSLLTGV